MTSGGTGSVPGAIDFVHLATFRNDGSVVIWTDESLVDGGSGSFISEYQVGDARPEPGAYCSAHIALPVADLQRDRVVNAWYMGGVDVIDFTQPSRLREVAYYDIAPDGPAGSDTRLAYAYAGPDFPRGLGIPVYATEERARTPAGTWWCFGRTSAMSECGPPPPSEPPDTREVGLDQRHH